MAHHPGTGGLRYVVALGAAAAIAWSAVLPARLSRPAIGAVAPVEVPAPAVADALTGPTAVQVAPPAPAGATRVARPAAPVPVLARSAPKPADAPASTPADVAAAAPPALAPAAPASLVQIARLLPTVPQVIEASPSAKGTLEVRETHPHPQPAPRPERARPEQPEVGAGRRGEAAGRGDDDCRAAHD